MAKCEFLSTCGFFKNYKGNTDAIIQGWIKMYCEDQEKSEKCARKKYRKEKGTPPPDNMSPTGKMLPSF